MNRFFGRHQMPDVAPAEAHRRQGLGAVLIDVPETSEWRAAHAPAARHLPLGQLARAAATLPLDQELLLICQSGRRSADAVRALQQAGFTRMVSVAGGMTAW